MKNKHQKHHTVISFYNSLLGVAPATCFLTWGNRLLMWRDHALMALRALFRTTQAEDVLWHSTQNEVQVALKKTYPNVPAAAQVLTGPNARGSFGIVLSTLPPETTKGRYILVTGLQHRSFFAYIKAYELIPIPVDMDPYAREFTFDPESVKDKDICMVVVTLCFGRVQKSDSILKWANTNGIPVVVDACLGPFFEHYPFESMDSTVTKKNGKNEQFVPDVVIWSCGADKEPCASSGAIMIFPTANNNTLYSAVRDKLHSLPRQSVYRSIVDNVLREFATWCVYNTLILHKLIGCFVFVYWGWDLAEASMQYYKNVVTPYKGSVYYKGTYLERPCTALVQTIRRAVQHDTSQETNLFYQAQREWLSVDGFVRCYPWAMAHRDDDDDDDPPPPRPFYDCLVVPDVKDCLAKMCSQGILFFPNTTYYVTPQDSKEPRAKVCDWYAAHLTRTPILARLKQAGLFDEVVKSFQDVLPDKDVLPPEECYQNHIK
eukprot:CAMPEP_0194027506 /NCGR_PEP_ID=MMETSP0009_2-20130614/1650_1 /TAXON_ID=210454 /ORGANISM="Grammatophora oceanica, Strain CCMP 410" /LENGTH=488 /DNA_ID=CAMNT_0038666597 /DNA_START=249 /DNA_END=1715 /DNA_ORIENTATION=-